MTTILRLQLLYSDSTLIILIGMIWVKPFLFSKK